MQWSIPNNRDIDIPEPFGSQLSDILSIHMGDLSSKLSSCEDSSEIGSLLGVLQTRSGGAVGIEELVPVLGSGSKNLSLFCSG